MNGLSGLSEMTKEEWIEFNLLPSILFVALSFLIVLEKERNINKSANFWQLYV